jgi:hypothetical protein
MHSVIPCASRLCRLAVYSIDMCRAGIDRLTRCANQYGPENLEPCCSLSGMVGEFCSNTDGFVEAYVTPDQMAYFNASMTFCKRNNGGGGGGQCDQAINQTLTCISNSGNGPQCCGAYYNVQSQCGNGNLFNVIRALLERAGNQDNVFTTYQLTNLLGMCPRTCVCVLTVLHSEISVWPCVV